MTDNPLKLPKGSVRALLALLIWAGIFILLMMNRMVPGEIWIAGGMIAAFYFGIRANQ